MGRRYLLVSPCRDEAEYLQITIDSVAAQSVLPALWLIVDDGSTDETPEILARAAAKYPFIRVVRRDNRGHRSVGPGVIDALYHGLSLVNQIERRAYPLQRHQGENRLDDAHAPTATNE